jgi:LCP family protein required for cell wall assembly
MIRNAVDTSQLPPVEPVAAPPPGPPSPPLTPWERFRRRWWVYTRWIVAGVPIALLGFFTGSALYVFTHADVFTGNEIVDRPATVDPFSMPLRLTHRVNVLLIGVDVTLSNRRQVVNVSRADTLMLVSFDPQRNRVSGLSIPRDTRAAIPGVGVTKINASYAFGGPELTIRTVQDLLGVPVHFYVKLGPESFSRFIDAIGGIDIDVEKDMKYTDRWAGLFIDLKKGPQHLTGRQAMGYVRFRHDALGDIARVERQQKMLLALFHKMKTPATMVHAPQLLRAVVENTQTNMTARELISLGVFASKLESSDFLFATLPGTISEAYWDPDPVKARLALTQMFYGVSPEALASTEVEVLNGSGIPGLARQTAQRLERLGFRVVRVDTARNLVTTTTIIDRTGRTDVVQFLAELLGSKPIRREPGGTPDITVMVARDLAATGARMAGR